MKHEKHCNQTFIQYLTQKDTQHDTVSVIYIEMKVTCSNIFKCFFGRGHFGEGNYSNLLPK